MAGDWIKLEKATIDKPEMAIIARRLGISRNDAFVEFIRLFSWADSNVGNDDGHVTGLSPSDGDSLAHVVPGFCDALASPDVGWLIADETGITFVNWERHNGKSAKRRLLDKEKKRKQRANSDSDGDRCPDANGTKKGLEKRREENKERESTRARQPSIQQAADDLTFIQGPTEAFQRFYEAYPNRCDKNAAIQPFANAVVDVEVKKKLSQPAAEEFLISAAAEYAGSPAGSNPIGGRDFRPSPGNWLTKGKYWDDKSAWQQPNGRPPPKQKPPKAKVNTEELADSLVKKIQGASNGKS